MPKSAYLKRRDEEFSAQLTQFKTYIPSYSATLGLSAGQVSAQAADADYFAYVLARQDLCAQCSQQWTAWKDIIREGGDTGTPPADETLPAAVTAVLPGIEKRFVTW